jgi:hypothetical protein
MTSPRFTHTLTQLAAGKALAAAGEDADVSVVKSTETYDLNLLLHRRSQDSCSDQVLVPINDVLGLILPSPV